MNMSSNAEFDTVFTVPVMALEYRDLAGASIFEGMARHGARSTDAAANATSQTSSAASPVACDVPFMISLRGGARGVARRGFEGGCRQEKSPLVKPLEDSSTCAT